MAMLWLGILAGAVFGASYGLSGYKNSGVEFNLKDFLIAFVPTTIVGGIAGYTGDTFEVVLGGPVGLGVAKLVRQLIKLIGNLFKK